MTMFTTQDKDGVLHRIDIIYLDNFVIELYTSMALNHQAKPEKAYRRGPVVEKST